CRPLFLLQSVAVTMGCRSAPGRVVLAPVLFHATLFLQVTEHAVQVVRLDFHRFGHVRGADPGLAFDQFHRLVGTGAAAAFTPFTRGGGAAAGAAGGFVGAAFGATGAAAAGAATRATLGDFSAELLEGFLGLAQLLAKLADRPLKGVAGLVENVSGGHLVPFHPKFRVTLERESARVTHTVTVRVR